MISPGSQQAILAWMMGTIQRCQGEALRQQGDFQLAMTRLLRQIPQDNATPLDAHLSRLENVDRELASLRAELERRGTHTAPPLSGIRVPPRLLQKICKRSLCKRSPDGARIRARSRVWASPFGPRSSG
jgi:hypothetical protein